MDTCGFESHRPLLTTSSGCITIEVWSNGKTQDFDSWDEGSIPSTSTL